MVERHLILVTLFFKCEERTLIRKCDDGYYYEFEDVLYGPYMTRAEAEDAEYDELHIPADKFDWDDYPEKGEYDYGDEDLLDQRDWDRTYDRYDGDY
jgi:hypothetical protein